MTKENEINAQEAAEFKLLNDRAELNAARKEAIKAEREKARLIAYTTKSVLTITALGVLSVAVACAGVAGMIHPYICIPVTLSSLCAAFLNFGVWFGRVTKK